MKKRRLGANGPDVSMVGLGCMATSGTYGPAEDEESIEKDILPATRELGIGVTAYGILSCGLLARGDDIVPMPGARNRPQLRDLVLEDNPCHEEALDVVEFAIMAILDEARDYKQPGLRIECLTDGPHGIPFAREAQELQWRLRDVR